jgi:hypothetical protein
VDCLLFSLLDFACAAPSGLFFEQYLLYVDGVLSLVCFSTRSLSTYAAEPPLFIIFKLITQQE